MDSQISQLMQNSSGDLSKFLSSQMIIERLGIPIAGTYFFLTSRSTIFKIKEKEAVPSLSGERHPILLVVLLFSFLVFIFIA